MDVVTTMTAETAKPYALVRLPRSLNAPTMMIVAIMTVNKGYMRSNECQDEYGEVESIQCSDCCSLTDPVDDGEVDLTLDSFGRIDHLHPVNPLCCQRRRGGRRRQHQERTEADSSEQLVAGPTYGTSCKDQYTVAAVHEVWQMDLPN